MAQDLGGDIFINKDLPTALRKAADWIDDDFDGYVVISITVYFDKDEWFVTVHYRRSE